jgi:hypothetical protein
MVFRDRGIADGTACQYVVSLSTQGPFGRASAVAKTAAAVAVAK